MAKCGSSGHGSTEFPCVKPIKTQAQRGILGNTMEPLMRRRQGRKYRKIIARRQYGHLFKIKSWIFKVRWPQTPFWNSLSVKFPVPSPLPSLPNLNGYLHRSDCCWGAWKKSAQKLREKKVCSMERQDRKSIPIITKIKWRHSMVFFLYHQRQQGHFCKRRMLCLSIEKTDFSTQRGWNM